MILTCPDCATRYLTKPATIGPNGRTVRCANCSATWFVPAETVDGPLTLTAQNEARPTSAYAQSPALSAPREASQALNYGAAEDDNGQNFIPQSAAGAIRERRERKRAARRVMGVSLMWLFTLAILGAAALGCYLFRGPIVDRFPQTATLYKAFGIDVASGGLLIDNVQTHSAVIDGTATLVVEGRIVNPGRESYPVRMIELSLHDSGGSALTRWRVELPAKILAPGQTADFITEYPNPPVDAIRLQYVFAGDQVLGAPAGQGLLESAPPENNDSDAATPLGDEP